MHSPHHREAQAALTPQWLLALGFALPLSTFNCTPTEIAEERYGSALQSCYEFPIAVDAGASPQRAFNDGLVRPPDCPDPYAAGGSGGSGGAPSGGSSGQSTTASGGTNTGAASAGAGGGDSSTAGTGGAPSAAAGEDSAGMGGANDPPLGAAGMPMQPSAGAGGGGAAEPFPLPPGCSEETVLQIFRGDHVDRLGQGCQDSVFGGCHNPRAAAGGLVAEGHLPDLMSENVAAELVGGSLRAPDGCDKFWIVPGSMDVTQSFLWQRVTSNTGDGDSCEKQMPIDSEAYLNAETLACLSAWILRVANGN